VFVTSLYTFRMLFLTFHGPERFRKHAGHAHGHGSAGKAHGKAHAESKHPQVAGAHAAAHADHGKSGGGHDHGHEDHGGHGSHAIEPRESPWVVTVPLILLAIPSLVIGYFTVEPVLFQGYFGNAIHVEQADDVVARIGAEFGGAAPFAVKGLLSLPFALAVAGFLAAWLFFLARPSWATAVGRAFSWLRTLLINKYYFDWINENIIAALTRLIGTGLWKVGDQTLIDGAMVNGSAETVGWFGSVMRRVQNGYLYSYAFWMMIGLAVLLGWFLLRA
jgi:NADH-quinone oxidoreductase subunit L